MTKLNRNTKQKIIIESAINTTNSFFNSEEIYHKVKNKDKTIGIATIYRFLKEMRKNGKLHSYICDRKLLYSKNHQSHTHFICEKCGKTEHIKINDINFLKKQISKAICHFQLDVYGICNSCKAN